MGGHPMGQLSQQQQFMSRIMIMIKKIYNLIINHEYLEYNIKMVLFYSISDDRTHDARMFATMWVCIFVNLL